MKEIPDEENNWLRRLLNEISTDRHILYKPALVRGGVGEAKRSPLIHRQNYLKTTLPIRNLAIFFLLIGKE